MKRKMILFVVIHLIAKWNDELRRRDIDAICVEKIFRDFRDHICEYSPFFSL